MWSESDPNRNIYQAKEQWHKEQRNLPIKEKLRILLKLQREDLELIKRLRPLKYYEKPWDIEI